MPGHAAPHQDSDPTASPVATYPPVGTPLPVRHYECYQSARSHLWALAISLPATSQHGYWDVLDLLDGLHDPLCRPPVAIELPSGRADHCAAAHGALAGLVRLATAPPGLDRCLEMLQECWAHDVNRPADPDPRDEP